MLSLYNTTKEKNKNNDRWPMEEIFPSTIPVAVYNISIRETGPSLLNDGKKDKIVSTII